MPELAGEKATNNPFIKTGLQCQINERGNEKHNHGASLANMEEAAVLQVTPLKAPPPFMSHSQMQLKCNPGEFEEFTFLPSVFIHLCDVFRDLV